MKNETTQIEIYLTNSDLLGIGVECIQSREIETALEDLQEMKTSPFVTFPSVTLPDTGETFSTEVLPTELLESIAYDCYSPHLYIAEEIAPELVDLFNTLVPDTYKVQYKSVDYKNEWGGSYQICVSVEQEFLLGLHRELITKHYAEYSAKALEMFRSRAGFWSYVSTDVKEWDVSDVQNWKYGQCWFIVQCGLELIEEECTAELIDELKEFAIYYNWEDSQVDIEYIAMDVLTTKYSSLSELIADQYTVNAAQLECIVNGDISPTSLLGQLMSERPNKERLAAMLAMLPDRSTIGEVKAVPQKLIDTIREAKNWNV